jgi:hypothetical protein
MTELSQSSPRELVRKALAPIAQLQGWIGLTIEAWRERSQLRRDLDALRFHGELDRTLAESGIAPGDVPRLMKAHPGTARQLADMMRRQGIDPTALPPGSALRDMEWQCGACGDWRKCRARLAAPEAPESRPAFCPNQAAFDALRRQIATRADARG